MAIEVAELAELDRLQAVAEQLGNVNLEVDPGDLLAELAAEIRDVASQASVRNHGAVTKRDAAAFLKVSEDTVARWLERGALRSIHIPESTKEHVEIESVLAASSKLRRMRREGVHSRFLARVAQSDKPKAHGKRRMADYGRPITAKSLGLEENTEAP